MSSYVVDEATWLKWRAEADELEELELWEGKGERDWNPDRIFLGIVGEDAYERLSGIPRRRRPEKLADGGTDFPGVDCKCVPYFHTPMLMRLAEGPFTAPIWFLAAVDMGSRRVRPVGYAPREQLMAARLKEYGNGPTRVLYEGELVKYDDAAGVAALFVGRAAA